MVLTFECYRHGLYHSYLTVLRAILLLPKADCATRTFNATNVCWAIVLMRSTDGGPCHFVLHCHDAYTAMTCIVESSMTPLQQQELYSR